MGCTKTIHTILSHIFQTFLKQKILIQLGKGPVVCHCGYCTHSRAENLFFVFFHLKRFCASPGGVKQLFIPLVIFAFFHLKRFCASHRGVEQLFIPLVG